MSQTSEIYSKKATLSFDETELPLRKNDPCQKGHGRRKHQLCSLFEGLICTCPIWRGLITTSDGVQRCSSLTPAHLLIFMQLAGIFSSVVFLQHDPEMLACFHLFKLLLTVCLRTSPCSGCLPGSIFGCWEQSSSPSPSTS